MALIYLILDSFNGKYSTDNQTHITGDGEIRKEIFSSKIQIEGKTNFKTPNNNLLLLGN